MENRTQSGFFLATPVSTRHYSASQPFCYRIVPSPKRLHVPYHVMLLKRMIQRMAEFSPEPPFHMLNYTDLLSCTCPISILSHSGAYTLPPIPLSLSHLPLRSAGSLPVNL